MIACCVSRPWGFGPRLGHIRLRSDVIRCELVRNVFSWECPVTLCLWAFLPETLRERLLQQYVEPSSQGGSVGSNPIGATNGQRPFTAVGGLSPFEFGVPLIRVLWQGGRVGLNCRRRRGADARKEWEAATLGR